MFLGEMCFVEMCLIARKATVAIYIYIYVYFGLHLYGVYKASEWEMETTHSYSFDMDYIKWQIGKNAILLSP